MGEFLKGGALSVARLIERRAPPISCLIHASLVQNHDVWISLFGPCQMNAFSKISPIGFCFPVQTNHLLNYIYYIYNIYCISSIYYFSYNLALGNDATTLNLIKRLRLSSASYIKSNRTIFLR